MMMVKGRAERRWWFGGLNKISLEIRVLHKIQHVMERKRGTL
jgi:hypothetical protein